MFLAKVPLRISFFGGGTDFANFFNDHGGAVISGPLNKAVYAIISDDFDMRLKLSYSKREDHRLSDINNVEHPLIRETLLIYKKFLSPIEITSIADITKNGSGLGSSSAFIVALIKALDARYGINRTVEEVAKLACFIELDRCSAPIGVQDQWAASLGRLSLINFTKSEISHKSLEQNDTFIQWINNWGMFYFTGRTRSANFVLRKQFDPTILQIDILLQMLDLVPKALKTIENQDFIKFGKLLHKSWLLKKNLSDRISISKIDDVYNVAIDKGAIGGKLLGAGDGGFLFLLAPPKYHERIKSHLREKNFFNDTKLLARSGEVIEF